MRLSEATLSTRPTSIARPVTSGDPERRIVDPGMGAFDRTRRAVYTQCDGSGWRIAGVSLRLPTVRDMLPPRYRAVRGWTGDGAAQVVAALSTRATDPLRSGGSRGCLV